VSLVVVWAGIVFVLTVLVGPFVLALFGPLAGPRYWRLVHKVRPWWRGFWTAVGIAIALALMAGTGTADPWGEPPEEYYEPDYGP